MRVALYARVSTSEQASDGTSLATQLDQCRTLIASRGWSLVGEFVDEAVSGADSQRPELNRLMAEVRSGPVDVIVVAKLDRLSRSLQHLANLFAELDALEVAVVSVAESFDSSTSTGRLMRHQLGSFAEFERDRITERMVEGLRRTASDGFWPGGPPPYGYRLVPDPGGSKHKQLDIHPEQRELLRLVYDLIVNQGYTTYSAAVYLNAHSYRTAKDRLWRHPNLCYRLRQTYLTGTWSYDRGGDPIELSIPAVFDPEEWARLQAAIKGQPRRAKQHLYPLTGRGRQHLFCPCGGNFHGLWRKEKNRGYYTCSHNEPSWGNDRCPYLPRTYPAADLDAAVYEQVLAVLSDPEYLRALAAAHLQPTVKDRATSDGIGTLRRHLAGLGQQRVQVIRQLASDANLHSESLHAALAEIDKEHQETSGLIHQAEQVDQLQQRLSSAPDRIAALVDTAQDLLHNPTPQLLADLFDILQIELHRASDSHTFQGTGSIPIPDHDSGNLLALLGEVREKAPQDRALRQRRSGPAADAAPRARGHAV